MQGMGGLLGYLGPRRSPLPSASTPATKHGRLLRRCTPAAHPHHNPPHYTCTRTRTCPGTSPTLHTHQNLVRTCASHRVPPQGPSATPVISSPTRCCCLKWRIPFPTVGPGCTADPTATAVLRGCCCPDTHHLTPEREMALSSWSCLLGRQYTQHTPGSTWHSRWQRSSMSPRAISCLDAQCTTTQQKSAHSKPGSPTISIQ